MNCARRSESNALWRTSEPQLLAAKISIEYSKKRCNCKCKLQSQQHRLRLQQVRSFQNGANNDYKKLVVCCRMEPQAAAPETRLACEQQRFAHSTALTPTAVGTVRATSSLAAATSDAANDAASNATRGAATCCSCEENKLRSTDGAAATSGRNGCSATVRSDDIVPKFLLALKFQLNTCGGPKPPAASPPKSSLLPLRTPKVALHEDAKSSSCSHRSCRGSSSCQHIAVRKANASPSPAPRPLAAANQRNSKHGSVLACLSLLLLQAAAVLTALSAILQSCRLGMQQQQLPHAQQILRRRYRHFFLCSLLSAQVLALAPTTLAQRGSSSAGLGLEIAIGGTTPSGAEFSSAAHAQQLLATPLQKNDAELVATWKMLKNSQKNVSHMSAHHGPAPDVSLLGGRSLFEFINRDNVLGRAHVAQPATAATVSPASSSSSSSSCQSCHTREKAKLENLESIKEHILTRLKLPKMPNITAAIQVPDEIIQNFYKISSKKKRRQGAAGAAMDAGKDGIHERLLELPAGGTAGDAMQGDDPQAYAWQDYVYVDEQHLPGAPAADGEEEDKEEEEEEEEEDDFEAQFYSRVNSVYVFPTAPRIRHNRRHEILNFKLDEHHATTTTITRTILHVYVRGRDWIREHEPALLTQSAQNAQNAQNAEDAEELEVVVSVHGAMRRQNATAVTHTIKLSETRHKVPPGQGRRVQIDVRQLPGLWTANRQSTQGLVIKGAQPWMRPLIVTGSGSGSGSSDAVQNKALTAFIEVLTQDERKTRRKRSTSLDCSERDNEVRCCRYPLRVNFTNFGWNWVVAPTSFNAYFCNGECKLGFLEKHAHTHLAALSTSAQPCCSPTKMSALRLLYFNSDQILVLSTIPNMSVEKCSCS